MTWHSGGQTHSVDECNKSPVRVNNVGLNKCMSYQIESMFLICICVPQLTGIVGYASCIKYNN